MIDFKAQIEARLYAAMEQLKRELDAQEVDAASLSGTFTVSFKDGMLSVKASKDVSAKEKEYAPVLDVPEESQEAVSTEQVEVVDEQPTASSDAAE